MISLKERLTDILIKNKLITEEQLNEAIEAQKKKGGKLRDIIVELNFVKEGDLISALSEGLDFPLIDLKRLKIDPEIVKIIPIEVSRHYQIVPISKMGDTVTLAMVDPLNIFAIDHVEKLTGYKINPIIASLQDIVQTVEVSYPDLAKDMLNSLVKEMSDTSIELIREEAEHTPTDQELGKLSQDAPVIKITNILLEEAVKKKASDILIEPFERKLRIRYRVDGILQITEAPPKRMHASVVSRIKVVSELDIAEHRLPQDGRFKARVAGREVDFRVSILPSSFGEKVAIRILDKSQAMLNLEQLGFSRDILDKLEKVSRLPHGMILVCGPTGSGKTTTLYSVLKSVDAPEKNIVTVEDPVEYQLEGINQVTVRQEIGLTFASALRSILRQDPNIIMIGEIRDFPTMDIAIKSALTGHLVLSTLHTTTASGSIIRLVNMGVEPYLINSSVVCIAAQRLIRKICTHCKEEYEVDDEILRTLRIKIEGKQKPKFFRGKGCNRCFNFGYSGRLGIAELLLLSPKVRELILNRAQEHMIKQQARQEGMRTLREEGMSAALRGFTTLEEVVRVTAPDEN
ncbi:MAG: secretion system protein E [Candidatus Omnitrophota bacterium]|jgi:type IV pilus assembly protein PilB|nr:MAG: secretion system protein E [Candidatus Omnitrophota bacterium]